MKYNKEFLISELQRFVNENGRVPVRRDMQSKFGYPGYSSFQIYFGTWNNALIAAYLDINNYHHMEILNGTEVCDNCGYLKSENQGWNYKNERRLCNKCYQKTLKNYMNGNLDPESNVGFAFASQRTAAKVLGLELKYDCNCSIGFDAPYDLFDKKFGYINVKAAVLNIKNNCWRFNLKNNYHPDTYIMLGFANDKSDILHVWITEPEDDLTFDEKKFKYKIGIAIYNTSYGLKRAEYWEVDCEPYNVAYHSMSLDNCKALRSD